MLFEYNAFSAFYPSRQDADSNTKGASGKDKQPAKCMCWPGFHRRTNQFSRREHETFLCNFPMRVSGSVVRRLKNFLHILSVRGKVTVLGDERIGVEEGWRFSDQSVPFKRHFQPAHV